MEPEIIGRCASCGMKLARLPEFTGLVSVTVTSAHVRYDTTCPARLAGHVLRATAGVQKIIEDAARADAETKLRKRRREIADQIADEAQRHIASHQAIMGEWHPGTCKGCGLDDQPVIGVPGAEYCRFCEELRVMTLFPPPLPPADEDPPAPGRPHPERVIAGMACEIACVLVAAIGGAHSQILAGLLCIWGVLLLCAAR